MVCSLSVLSDLCHHPSQSLPSTNKAAQYSNSKYSVQEFSSDMNSRPVKRIEDVVRLRTAQFSEDSGPIAHPIRPESYIKMDNFYTVTVYEKGAEIIRVYHTLLGKEGFRCFSAPHLASRRSSFMHDSTSVASVLPMKRFDALPP